MAAIQPETLALPDAAPGNWVDRHAPAAVRPYLQLARFDRPGHQTTGDRSRRSRSVGHDYLHCVVDDHSRLAVASHVAWGETSAPSSTLARNSASWARGSSVAASRMGWNTERRCSSL